jgi:Cdc6-like AAA superfamily ATPase
MIDEIDKAPRNIIKELLEIAAAAAPRYFVNERLEIDAVPIFNIPSISGPFACRVVIIGLSNSISFSTEVRVSPLAEHAFKDVPFAPYTPADLQSILIKRCMGTFTDGAISMLAGKGLRAASGNFKRSETIDLPCVIIGVIPVLLFTVLILLNRFLLCVFVSYECL